jgi:hypothetical protein
MIGAHREAPSVLRRRERPLARQLAECTASPALAAVLIALISVFGPGQGFDRAGALAIVGVLLCALSSMMVTARRLPSWMGFVAGAALVSAGWRLGLGSGQPAYAAALIFTLGVGLLAAALVALAVSRSARQQRAPAMLLLVPYTLIAAGCLVLLVGAYARPALPAVLSPDVPPRQQLGHMRLTDQRDRLTGLMLLDAGRDSARLGRVLELDRQGAIAGAESSLDAALILLHGTCPAHFRRALELASVAAKSGMSEAAQLVRAAEDRWLLSIGREQRHGTQLLVWGAAQCDAASGSHL